MRAQGEREGEGARLKAQMSRGKWASVIRALKGSRACGGGRKRRGRGRVHGGRLGTGPDGWGPRTSERGRACARRETAPTG
jgi:hypothetical protein